MKVKDDGIVVANELIATSERQRHSNPDLMISQQTFLHGQYCRLCDGLVLKCPLRMLHEAACAWEDAVIRRAASGLILAT